MEVGSSELSNIIDVARGCARYPRVRFILVADHVDFPLRGALASDIMAGMVGGGVLLASCEYGGGGEADGGGRWHLTSWQVWWWWGALLASCEYGGGGEADGGGALASDIMAGVMVGGRAAGIMRVWGRGRGWWWGGAGSRYHGRCGGGGVRCWHHASMGEGGRLMVGGAGSRYHAAIIQRCVRWWKEDSVRVVGGACGEAMSQKKHV